MDINVWLKIFKRHWQTHNVEGVLSLFDRNVIYYETPFRKLASFDEVTKEWEAIRNQDDVNLDFEVFSSHDNKHSVIWKLRYHDKENTERNYSGTYLIELNAEGLCTYFHHSCEST